MLMETVIKTSVWLVKKSRKCWCFEWSKTPACWCGVQLLFMKHQCTLLSLQPQAAWGITGELWFSQYHTNHLVIIFPRSLPETRLSTPLPLDHPVTMQTKVRFHKGLLYISIWWYDSFRPSRTNNCRYNTDYNYWVRHCIKRRLKNFHMCMSLGKLK